MDAVNHKIWVYLIPFKSQLIIIQIPIPKYGKLRKENLNVFFDKNICWKTW